MVRSLLTAQDQFGLILDLLRGGDPSYVAQTIRGFPDAQQELMMQELDYFGLETAVFPRPWFEGGVLVGARADLTDMLMLKNVMLQMEKNQCLG
jgi:hypothetical protein